jgi:hypothetical protein
MSSCLSSCLKGMMSKQAIVLIFVRVGVRQVGPCAVNATGNCERADRDLTRSATGLNVLTTPRDQQIDSSGLSATCRLEYQDYPVDLPSEPEHLGKT